MNRYFATTCVFVIACCGLASTGCGLVPASALDLFWVNTLTGDVNNDVEQLSQELDNLNQDVQSGLGQPGVPGEPGADGQDGANGQDGVDGQNGADGQDGIDGQDGADGANGRSCWDVNNNGTADASEDINGDGAVDSLDCQGADGEACWDLNADGVADPATEDTNGDGFVDILDCQGADGQDLTGVLSRAFITADGDNVAGSVGVEVEYDHNAAPGRYTIYIRVPDDFRADDDLTDPNLRFPVFITPTAEAGFGAPAPILAQVEILASLDTDNDGRLETRVFKVHVRNLNFSPPSYVSYVANGFSILMMQP
jgi:hypothetical protein